MSQPHAKLQAQTNDAVSTFINKVHNKDLKLQATNMEGAWSMQTAPHLWVRFRFPAAKATGSAGAEAEAGAAVGTGAGAELVVRCRLVTRFGAPKFPPDTH